MKRLRATKDRWLFAIMTNDGDLRFDTKGPIDPVLGQFLRAFQAHKRLLSVTQRAQLIRMAKSLDRKARRPI